LWGGWGELFRGLMILWLKGFFCNGGQRLVIKKVCNNNYADALAELESNQEVALVYVSNTHAVSGLALSC
jgi:hypothetical protein